MKHYLIEGEIFDKIDFRIEQLPKGEYDSCQFKNCDFSNGDFSGIIFLDCTFVSCNLSMVKMTKTTFSNVLFKDSKLLGTVFNQCNSIGITFKFEDCFLDNSSFYQLKIRNTLFKNTRLHDVDFTETDLISAVFMNCDLNNVKFENTLLEKADFRTSYNYILDPTRNRIKKAKFSLNEVVGLLSQFNIEIDR
jgi:fluoroquinolone resistance protein